MIGRVWKARVGMAVFALGLALMPRLSAAQNQQPGGANPRGTVSLPISLPSESASTSTDDADAPVSSDRLVELARRLSSTPSLSRLAPLNFPSAAEPARPPVPHASASSDVGGRESLPLGGSAENVASIANSRTPAMGSGWVFNTMTALGIVIALILAVRLLIAKAYGQGAATSSGAIINVLSRMTIAPRSHVLLLKVGDRVLVVSESASGMRTLCEITDEVEVARLVGATSAGKASSVSQGFSQLLSKAASTYRPDQHSKDEGADEQEHYIDRTRDQLSNLLSRIRTMARENVR